MIRPLVQAAAALALAACGVGGGEENESNDAASAAANLAETLPTELGGDDLSDANLGYAAEAPGPSAAPARRDARPATSPPKAEPRRAAPAKAPPPVTPPRPVKADADPHAGHDLSNGLND